MLRSAFVEASVAALERARRAAGAEGLGEMPVIVGYVDRPTGAPSSRPPAGAPPNAAAFLLRGQVVAHTPSTTCRTTASSTSTATSCPATRCPSSGVHGVDVALDHLRGPLAGRRPDHRRRRPPAPGCVVDINASPYERDKDDARLGWSAARAAEAGCTIAYVNMVGGQDELVFDGDSIVVDAAGAVIARAPQFAEGCVVVDLTLPAAADDRVGAVDVRTTRRWCVERVDLGTDPVAAVRAGGRRRRRAARRDEARSTAALVVGHAGLRREERVPLGACIGLSGGIDSALVAAIAVDALGAEQRARRRDAVAGTPREHSKDDAAELARRTGHATTAPSPIGADVDAYMETLDLTGLAEENLQSRLRGIMLMALSNQEGHLVLATGNKSELAVGYSTLYGDSVGGFGADQGRVQVDGVAAGPLAQRRGRRARRDPADPGELDRQAAAAPSCGRASWTPTHCPTTPVLDAILDGYVDRDIGPAGDRRGRVTTRRSSTRSCGWSTHAEYKRRQYPPGTKICVRRGSAATGGCRSPTAGAKANAGRRPHPPWARRECSSGCFEARKPAPPAHWTNGQGFPGPIPHSAASTSRAARSAGGSSAGFQCAR